MWTVEMVEGGDPAFVMEFVHGAHPEVNGERDVDAHFASCVLDKVTIGTSPNRNKKNTMPSSGPHAIGLPLGRDLDMSISILAIAVAVLVAMSIAVVVGVVLFIVLMGRKSNTPHDEEDD
jgi:hypothetical protein